MSPRYSLKPTPKDHKLWGRPFYHEIRDDLLKLRNWFKGVDTAVTPDTVDWSPGMRPARDQGQEGACSGFANAADRALAHWMASGQLMPEDFAPRFAYWVARSFYNLTDQDCGATLGDELAGTEEKGICLEVDCPYDAGDYAVAPNPGAFTAALPYRIGQAVRVELTAAGIEQVLADRRAILIGFEVPPSFESCLPSGILSDPTGEPSQGLHAGIWYGYARPCQQLLEQNSWGQGWGAAGRCRMPYSYIERVVEAWTFVPVP